jgi:hypothetical protein
MKRLWPVLVATGMTLVAAIAATGSQAQPGTATPDGEGRLVPDLVAMLPGTVHYDTRISARRGPRRLLSFSGAVVNNGAGPLILDDCSTLSSDGRRRFAVQWVDTASGTRTTPSPRACFFNGFQYTSGGGHSHFHLLDFMRYELRTVDGRRVRADRKQGFCLGDRYDNTGPDARFPAEPARAVFRGQCARGRPRASNVTMGLSVGYGDDYPRGLHGQFIDITGLRPGRYVLVFRVNPNGNILDQHSDNDVSSLLLSIDDSRRKLARILSWCTNTDSCTVAGRHKRQVPAWRIRD